MKTEVSKFKFAIPELTDEQVAAGITRENVGKKVEKAFEFDVCENQEEAIAVMTKKKWSLIDMVNDNLKSNARSTAYQAALLPYRPSEVSAEDIKERMIRDYIRLGIPEDTARKQVEALLATQPKAE